MSTMMTEVNSTNAVFQDVQMFLFDFFPEDSISCFLYKKQGC